MWRIKSLDAILLTAEKKPLRRSLGPLQLTMLGVGGIIGTGIFVLTANAAQKAGPAMVISFVIAGAVCTLAALCYAEMAALVPVSGSAYTYTYVVTGEIFAWIVGWALILEYGIAASTVSVGWSGYAVGLLENLIGIKIPHALVRGPFDGGLVNLPALLIALVLTALLIKGTRESARVNAILVAIKIGALTLFAVLAVPVMQLENFTPFDPLGMAGVSAAAASIVFAFIGFDAVSTAAEETRDPQRNMPIGIIGSLLVCTIFYVVVVCGVIGAVGAQPVLDATGAGLRPGSLALSKACAAIGDTKVVCSNEALAWTLRQIGWQKIGNLIGLAAGMALPSVILVLLFGQSRILFAMSRDGLLPPALSEVHSRFHTPHVILTITGIAVALFAAFFPVGILADISNSGTLFAFFMVAGAVLILRRADPDRPRPFKAPAVIVTAPVAMAGCIYLFLSLSTETLWTFFIWALAGLAVYFLYGYRKSHLGNGVSGNAPIVPGTPLSPTEAAGAPGQN